MFPKNQIAGGNIHWCLSSSWKQWFTVIILNNITERCIFKMCCICITILCCHSLDLVMMWGLVVDWVWSVEHWEQTVLEGHQHWSQHHGNQEKLPSQLHSIITCTLHTLALPYWYKNCTLHFLISYGNFSHTILSLYRCGCWNCRKYFTIICFLDFYPPWEIIINDPVFTPRNPQTKP